MTGRRAWAVAAAGVVAGATSIALGARWSVSLPGTSIPQTAQTLAVVLAGAVLGPRSGAAAAGLYVVLGVLGVPVFAGKTAGLDRLLGPSGGYLVGFVLAAALVGEWRRRGGNRTVALGFAGAALAHAVVLGAGWSRLALTLGAGPSFLQGVAPFVLGAGVKSAIAAAVLRLPMFARARRRS